MINIVPHLKAMDRYDLSEGSSMEEFTEALVKADSELIATEYSLSCLQGLHRRSEAQKEAMERMLAEAIEKVARLQERLKGLLGWTELERAM